MGNTKSKKIQKEPDKLFDRERLKEQKLQELKKKNLDPLNKRKGIKENPLPPVAPAVPPGPGPAPSPVHVRSYDIEALERMRYQLRNDSDAFLLNNILLSVQFFENYEREVQHIKDNPMNEREHAIDEAMVRHHKHVFFADQLQECVHDRVRFMRRRGQLEPLSSPRLFVIYDNIEACEPGDTSDYSAVLDAPFYKLRVEDCRESGYVKLKKIEVLESNFRSKQSDPRLIENNISDDSIYTDSEKESIDSDDPTYGSKGEALLQKIKMRLNEPRVGDAMPKPKINLNEKVDIYARRRSGPIKHISTQAEKGNISNIKNLAHLNGSLPEESEILSKEYINDNKDIHDIEVKPRKSILKTKNSRRLSGPCKEMKVAQFNSSARSSFANSIAEDTETSGYRSNSSSRYNESSEAESDYGYSTITESATPKPIELSLQSNFSASSGIVPDECWNSVQVKSIDDDNSDDDEKEYDEIAPRASSVRKLYETHYYLSSVSFMTNFVDNFMIKLGTSLGLSQEAISNALTQGASIYCDSFKNDIKVSYEVVPALLAAWPNAANQWIIRERRIIQNPRTNFSYQWPTKYMVNKAIGFGCLLEPVGFRPKRGSNPEQKMQWRITFPAAERYLESCLAHSHIRCYLFALALHKTFMENETSKIGIDASHIKNHLFWQCEDNYAKWPEDRLGETLRLFLKSFYVHFGHAKFPNYFISNCNDFKSIPKPLLLKLQRRLADILEAPVMHILNAVDKLKYMKKDFYPAFNAQKLYSILTHRNPLRLLNPNIPDVIPNNIESSDSDDERDVQTSFWTRTKTQDKQYQWNKKKHRQMEERRQANAKKHKSTVKTEVEIRRNVILPKKMEAERRRLVLEFFIPHFIAMARSSEKFESIKQAVIYLEQAHRLCVLLLDEPSGDTTANEYLDVIRDKLADCQRKLVNQGGFKLPPRRESNMNRVHVPIPRKGRPKYQNIINQDSPNADIGIPAFTFVDVHMDSSTSDHIRKGSLKLSDANEIDSEEESKL